MTTQKEPQVQIVGLAECVLAERPRPRLKRKKNGRKIAEIWSTRQQEGAQCSLVEDFELRNVDELNVVDD